MPVTTEGVAATLKGEARAVARAGASHVGRKASVVLSRAVAGAVVSMKARAAARAVASVVGREELRGCVHQLKER